MATRIKIDSKFTYFGADFFLETFARFRPASSMCRPVFCSVKCKLKLRLSFSKIVRHICAPYHTESIYLMVNKYKLYFVMVTMSRLCRDFQRAISYIHVKFIK